MIIEDREGDETEFIFELRLLDHLVEKTGDLVGRIVESPATERAEHQRIVPVEQTDTENGSDFVTGDIERYLGHTAIPSETDFVATAEIEGGASDHSRVERILHKDAVIPLSKESNRRRINGAETGSDRIVLPGSQRIAISLSTFRPKRKDRTSQSTFASDAFLLGSGPGLHAPAGMSAAGEIEKQRTVTLFYQAAGSLDAIASFHHHGCSPGHGRSIDSRYGFLKAFPATKHIGKVKTNHFPGRGRISTVFDAASGGLEDAGVFSFEGRNSGVVRSVVHVVVFRINTIVTKSASISYYTY